MIVKQMRASMELFLHELGLPKNVKGYRYLLCAAELAAEGVPIGPAMLSEVGERNGSRYHFVRKSLQCAMERILKTDAGRRYLGECDGQDLYFFLTQLFLKAYAHGAPQ